MPEIHRVMILNILYDNRISNSFQQLISIGSEENPSLLHFAARFGLEKLAWQLLECPGADIACDMRNVNDFTPADLAEQAGHIKLAHQLRGYMVRFLFKMQKRVV